MDLTSEKANQGGRYIVRKERGKYERPTLRGLRSGPARKLLHLP